MLRVFIANVGTLAIAVKVSQKEGLQRWMRPGICIGKRRLVTGKILRFVQVPTALPNQWDYFNESMSTEAQDQQWAVTMAPLLKEMTPVERKALKGIEDDSWEAGNRGWRT